MSTSQFLDRSRNGCKDAKAASMAVVAAASADDESLLRLPFRFGLDGAMTKTLLYQRLLSSFPLYYCLWQEVVSAGCCCSFDGLIGCFQGLFRIDSVTQSNQPDRSKVIQIHQTKKFKPAILLPGADINVIWVERYFMVSIELIEFVKG